MVTEFHDNFLIKKQVAKQPKLSASSSRRFSGQLDLKNRCPQLQKVIQNRAQNRQDTPKMTHALAVLCALERDGEIPH